MGAACAGQPEPLGKVKIFYFPGLQSRGFIMAAILEVGQVDYEFVEVDVPDFLGGPGKKKAIWGSMPEMQLPDGTKMAEVCAICSTLSRYYPILAGVTPADEGISNMIGTKIIEIYSTISAGPLGPIIAMNMTKAMWEDKKALPDLMKAHDEAMEQMKPLIAKLNELCSSAGKFTSTGTTWGELFAWGFLYQWRHAKLAMCTPMPANLAKFMDEMEKLEGVKKAIAGTTQMGKQEVHIIDAKQFK